MNGHDKLVCVCGSKNGAEDYRNYQKFLRMAGASRYLGNGGYFMEDKRINWIRQNGRKFATSDLSLNFQIFWPLMGMVDSLTLALNVGLKMLSELLFMWKLFDLGN